MDKILGIMIKQKNNINNIVKKLEKHMLERGSLWIKLYI